MKKVLCLASIAAVLALNSYAKDYGEYVVEPEKLKNITNYSLLSL